MLPYTPVAFRRRIEAVAGGVLPHPHRLEPWLFTFSSIEWTNWSPIRNSEELTSVIDVFANQQRRSLPWRQVCIRDPS